MEKKRNSNTIAAKKKFPEQYVCATMHSIYWTIIVFFYGCSVCCVLLFTKRDVHTCSYCVTRACTATPEYEHIVHTSNLLIFIPFHLLARRKASVWRKVRRSILLLCSSFQQYIALHFACMVVWWMEKAGYWYTIIRVRMNERHHLENVVAQSANHLNILKCSWKFDFMHNWHFAT